MIVAIATFLLFALTRAEIIERMKAPVITQAEGLVKVYADCPEDMRREFQMPIASCASDMVSLLYRGLGEKSRRFAKPGIVIHVGDVRTNIAEVVDRVTTNDANVVTRIYLKAPGFANLDFFKLALVKAFYRSVKGKEITNREAVEAFRRANPEMRIEDERIALERWLAIGDADAEEAIKMLRKIVEPGKSSRRDVLTFASRLYLYPPTYDIRFAGESDTLAFRDAIELTKKDPFIRIVAMQKAHELPVFGGGRGEALLTAAQSYAKFLTELAKGELDSQALSELLNDADGKLAIAYEDAERYDLGKRRQ